jgi:hypothetical protein
MRKAIHLLLGGTAESNAATMVERRKKLLVPGFIHFDVLGVGAGVENAQTGSMASVLASRNLSRSVLRSFSQSALPRSD